MQILILGCGTSTGVPVPACDCSVCMSPNPRNKRTRASVVITLESGENIVIDTGPDFRFQALRAKLQRVDAVLFTHCHADHVMGIDDLRGFNFASGQRIPCYGNEQTLNTLKHLFSYIFDPNLHYEGGMLPQLSLNNINVGTPFDLFGVTILPFQLMHGKMEVVGYKIKDLVYATDCNYVPEESIEKIKNCSILIIDGLRHKFHNTHFTINDAIATSRRIEAKKTYLTHLTHSVDYERDSKLLPDGISLTYDELILTT